MFDHEDRKLIRELIEQMSANTDALATLTTSVDNNTTATNAAVAALAAAGTPADDISAGVNAQAAQIDTNTAALNTAVTPPATTPTPAVPATPVEAATSGAQVGPEGA